MVRMGKGLRLKAKELRKKKPKELIQMMSEIDKELAVFRGQQHLETGDTLKDPGKFQNLKKNKAIILTVLTENKHRRDLNDRR